MKRAKRNGLVSNMPAKSLDSEQDINFAGIIDVGIIIVAHFNNPIQKDMIEFLKPVLNWKNPLLIPNTTILGAFHILTSYLRVSRVDAKKALLETFTTDSPCFVSDIRKSVVVEALEQATCYKIESWDGYLIALAKSVGTNIIYTLDEKLSKANEIITINPIQEIRLKEYHNWLESKLRRA